MSLSIVSVPCPGSPDISTLAYSAQFDISGALPSIVLTNASTVIHATSLKWWYVITTPSGTPIHTGSVTTPDVNLVAWTTLTIPTNSWPLLFGNPPCAQVEFSSTSPYICTLYVQDSASNIFSAAIMQTIVRPNGNTQDSCGNFGAASISVNVNCNSKTVQCVDGTNFTYNNILVAAVQSNEWILEYPTDPAGNTPANGTAANTPYVNFTIGYSGAGYVLNILDYATYDMGNGASIKVQYKAINPDTGAPGLVFAVLCNIDLCKLQCQIKTFYELAKQRCGVVDDPATMSKMSRMNFLFNQAIIGILQPLCGINVPEIVQEIQKVGNLSDNCNCGCTDTGINFNYPLGPGNGGSGGCCPISSSVIDSSTNIAPALCPQSYFPVQVKDPTGTTVIGIATDISSLVSILNAYPSWQAYGVAFPEGQCTVGWFPATGVVSIPNIKVILGTTTILSSTTSVGNIVTKGTTNPPPGCPTGDPYPVKVYDPLGLTIIGIANNINDVVSILNANAGWQAYGVASVQDNCHVQWAMTVATEVIPNIQVDSNTTSTSCSNGSTIYTLSIVDPCATSSVLTPASFPGNFYIDFGLGVGKVSLGNIASLTALIAAYNATATKPASISFAAGSVFGQIVVTNTNCTAYSGTIVLTGNLGSESFLLYGGNHSQMIASPPAVGTEQGFGMALGALIGKIPGLPNTVPYWHTCIVGHYLLFTVTTLGVGQLYVYDISSPLNPSLLWAIALPDTGSGNCFTGVPNSQSVSSGGSAIPSIYGLYFPTDNPGQMFATSVFVFESSTGSAWKVDVTTGTVTTSFTNQQLRGKCPRVIGGSDIYFTQDGNMETTGGNTSGVPIGDVVVLATGSFNAGGIALVSIFNSPSEYVWAATYDGINTIYFAGVNGTLAKYSISAVAVTNRYINAFAVSNSRLNIKYFANQILASSLGFAGLTTGTVSLSTPALPTITVTPFANFTPPGSTVANNASHYNALPLGNCLVAVTYDNYADSAHPQGGVALFKLDGTFVGTIPLLAGDVYNVVAVPNISVYVPTSLV